MDKYLIYKIGLVCLIMIMPSMSAFQFEPSFGTSNIYLKNLENENINNDLIETMNYAMNFSKPDIYEKENGLLIDIKEADSYLHKSGEYKLLYYSKIFTFPLGTEIIDVKCYYSIPETIHIDKKVDVVSNPNNYLDLVLLQNQGEKYQRYYWKTGGGIENGKHVLFLVFYFYPLDYLEKNNTIVFFENFEINISYKKTPSCSLENNDYNLLILSPNSFSESLEKLIEHKNNHGVKTKLVTLNEIYQDTYFTVGGRDKAEEIKYFIFNAFNNWGIDFVLLVGNINKFPIRKTWMGTGEYERTPLTDLYYADLCFGNGTFCSWDSNNNGFYGEVWHGTQDDLVDLYPDIYIGRLACNNVLELNIAIDKIIQYEDEAFGTEWSNKIILIGGDTHPSNNDYLEGEILIDEIAKATPDQSHVMLKTSNGTFSPDSLNGAINEGGGFVCYAGHGFEIGLSTHPPNSEEWISYNFYHMLGLKNKDKLPIVFFNACLTARLDYNIANLLADIVYFSSPLPKLGKRDDINFPVLYPCIAWSMITKPNGGAVATIGATRVSYSIIDQSGEIKGGCCYLTLKFFESFSKSEYLSEMLVSAKNDFLNNASWYDPFIVEEFVLLGDPTLRIGGYE